MSGNTRKAISQTQRESDERRGMVVKGFKMSKELAETIANLAKERGIPQNKLIEEAIEAYKKAVASSAI